MDELLENTGTYSINSMSQGDDNNDVGSKQEYKLSYTDWQGNSKPSNEIEFITSCQKFKCVTA
jgi:hypothetical protein